jgi:hypothetical protein
VLRAQHLGEDPRLVPGRPLVIWGAGRKTRKRCELLLGQGFEVKAWIDIDPKKIGNRLGSAQVVDPGWLESRNPRPFVLNYVTNHGARDEITTILEQYGYRAGADYLSVG